MMAFTVRRARERRDWQCPLVLGIDEPTLHKGCRFATTFCDHTRPHRMLSREAAISIHLRRSKWHSAWREWNEGN